MIPITHHNNYYPLLFNKNETAKELYNIILTNILGYSSFITIVACMCIPMAFTASIFLYFGLLYGILFVLAVCTYNYLESKYHPKGDVGRRWDTFINGVASLWESFTRIKHVDIVKLGSDYPQDRKYMFCFHPHGILFLGPCSFIFSFSEHFPGIRLNHLLSSSCFIAPIFRQFCFWIGGIPVTRDAANKATQEGNSLSMIPGGLAEMLLADPRPRKLHQNEIENAIFADHLHTTTNNDQHKDNDDSNNNNNNNNSSSPSLDDPQPRKTVVLYMQKRKGFIKMALELGLDLVPVFTFGELENYYQVDSCLSLRMRLSRLIKLPLLFAYGKFGLIPFLGPMTVVVGKPIAIVQDARPDIAAIDAFHKKYLEQLSHMFEENKVKYGYADARLIFM